MRDVAIVGRGTTPYGVHDAGIKELATTAVARALDSSRLERSAVEALTLGNFAAGMLEGQELLAPLVTDAIGLEDVPVMKTEGACASSGIAFHHARQQIAIGVHDVVVVVGAEKMTLRRSRRPALQPNRRTLKPTSRQPMSMSSNSTTALAQRRSAIPRILASSRKAKARPPQQQETPRSMARSPSITAAGCSRKATL